jgi:hypothetical protein
MLRRVLAGIALVTAGVVAGIALHLATLRETPCSPESVPTISA